MIGLVPIMVRCECWVCLFDMVLDVFLSWSDVSAGRAILTWCQIKVLKNTYIEARPTTSMEKGWLCRTSCDEKNHEIAPMMISVMIQIQW